MVGGLATGAGELVVGTAGEPGVGSTGVEVHATSIAAATTADSRFIVEGDATGPSRLSPGQRLCQPAVRLDDDVCQ